MVAFVTARHMIREIIIARQAKWGPISIILPKRGSDSSRLSSLQITGGRAVIKPLNIPAHAPFVLSFLQ